MPRVKCFGSFLNAGKDSRTEFSSGRGAAVAKPVTMNLIAKHQQRRAFQTKNWFKVAPMLVIDWLIEALRSRSYAAPGR